jgi:predicted Zn-dependent protease
MKCKTAIPAWGGLLCILLLGGCTGMSGGQLPPVVDQGVPGAETYRYPETGAASQTAPRAPARVEPPAVVALLEHAEQQANAGDLESAAVTLERAIRIDSRNPILWHHLATVRLAEGEPQQAEQLAIKSNSLAAGNHALQARNWELIAQARRSRGDTSGARSADRQARALETR